MLATLGDADRVARHLEGADDVREREGIGLAADLDQQRPDHRQSERQLELEARPAPRLRHDADDPADLLDHVLDDVQADAAARYLGHALLHGEAGQEQELEQLDLA